MQTTSALHKSIFADFATCQMEYKAVIDGVEYGKDDIEAISTPVELYPASISAWVTLAAIAGATFTDRHSTAQSSAAQMRT